MVQIDQSDAVRKVRPLVKSLVGILKESLGRKRRSTTQNRSHRRHTISTDEFGTLRNYTRDLDIPGTSRSKTEFYQKRRSKFKLALQAEDEDLVVITGLDHVPFCCPDELCSMSRKDLLRVATFLNVRLPKALAIDTRPLCSDSFLRQKIASTFGLTGNKVSSRCTMQSPQNIEYRGDTLQTPEFSPRSASLDLSTEMPSVADRRGSLLESLAEQDGELDFDPIGTELSPSRRSRGRRLYRSTNGLRRPAFSTITESPTPKSKSARILDYDSTSLFLSSVIPQRSLVEVMNQRPQLDPDTSLLSHNSRIYNDSGKAEAAHTVNLSNSTPDSESGVSIFRYPHTALANH